MTKIKFGSHWNSSRRTTQAAVPGDVLVSIRQWTSGLHLLSSPRAITNTRTHHRTKRGHNMFTKSTDFREQFWQKKWVKAKSHKQISHSQHVSFKQSDRDSVKLCHIASSHQHLLWLRYLWKKDPLKWKYSSQNSLLIKANWEKACLC